MDQSINISFHQELKVWLASMVQLAPIDKCCNYNIWPQKTSFSILWLFKGTCVLTNNFFLQATYTDEPKHYDQSQVKRISSIIS